MGKYLSPESLDYETKCAVIFYPKDDGDLFLAALRGQLTRLESFWVWEGSRQFTEEIAYIWALHNVMSEDAWYKVDCADIPILTGDEVMNVNVNVSNCGCGCGCGCGGSGGQGGQPFGINPLEPPPSNTPAIPSSDPVEDIDQWKCDAANQLWDDWYQFFQEVGIVGGAGLATVTALAQIAVAFTILTAGVGFLLVLIAGIAINVAGGVMGLTKDWMELHKDGLICAIVSATSPAQAASNVAAYIAAFQNDPHGTFAGYWIGQVLMGITGDTNWNLIFQEDSFPIASSNVGSDCSACEPSPLIDFLGDGTWYLVPLIAEGSPAISGTATFTADGNEWT